MRTGATSSYITNLSAFRVLKATTQELIAPWWFVAASRVGEPNQAEHCAPWQIVRSIELAEQTCQEGRIDASTEAISRLSRQTRLDRTASLECQKKEMNIAGSEGWSYGCPGCPHQFFPFEPSLTCGVLGKQV